MKTKLTPTKEQLASASWVIESRAGHIGLIGRKIVHRNSNRQASFVSLRDAVRHYYQILEQLCNSDEIVDFSSDQWACYKWMQMIHHEMTKVSIIKKPAKGKAVKLFPSFPSNVALN